MKRSKGKDRAIFLDRDGVINEILWHQDLGIIETPFTVGQFKLLPGVGQAVKLINQLGYKAILVSNQPGVAMKHFTRETLQRITEKMHRDLAKSGGYLDGVYYCIHHPSKGHGKLKKQCKNRKPKPGMLLDAARDFNLDLKNSWFIGDSILDVQAGLSAGCKTMLLAHLKCDLCHQMAQRGVKPHAMAKNLLDAVRSIKKQK